MGECTGSGGGVRSKGRGGGGDDEGGDPSTSYDAGSILAAAGKSLESLPEGGEPLPVRPCYCFGDG